MKCAEYQHRPMKRKAGNTPEERRQMHITALRKRLWQAEFIGWPALAESFRRDLRAMGEKA